MSLISVIIPTYDRAPLLVDAVESVLRQEGACFELIVIDDGSTDSTAALMGRYAGRLRYVQRGRGGVAAARNHGARLARGGWLAFLDSDDEWLPGKLAAQLAFHRDQDAIRISQTEEIWIRNGRRINPRAYHQKPAGDFFVSSVARCLVSPSAVMLHRDLFERVGGFDESLAVCEDYDLWLRIAQRARVGLIAHPFVIKRGGHADQLSRQYWGMDRFRVAALTRLLAAEALEPGRRQAVVDMLVQKCAVLAQGARRRQREDEAERYLALAEVCVRG
jgi:glycosyltransferase involved in cell wall biosynthesis